MRISHFTLYTLLSTLYSLLAACSSNDGPDSLAPEVTVLDADSITRTSAVLHGYVSQRGTGEVTTLLFHYGTTSPPNTQHLIIGDSVGVIADSNSQHLTPNTLSATTGGKRYSSSITNLTPGTTYYYSLEAGNGRSSVMSDVKSFVTLPVSKPSLSTPVILSQGPMSVICNFDITDNGGGEITEAGYYLTAPDGIRKRISSSLPPANLLIASLDPNTTYSLSAYARNVSGETVSTPISFTTGNAIVLVEPGQLSELIASMTSDDWQALDYNISISGPLNGDDIITLRTLLDASSSMNDNLWTVNLTDASIVEGGSSYGYGHFTVANTVSYGMFAGCNIHTILLPDDVTTIEQDAFRDCKYLKQMTIPASAQKVSPSTGCTSLHDITVSAANSNYTTFDGVLFDKDCTTILWYPSGRTESSYTLPSSVTTIPSAIFQGCTSLTTVHLGSNIQLISDYAFDGCLLSSIYIDATIPPVCMSSSFSSFDATIYVPASSLNIYKYHKIWGKFNIVKSSG